jgi:diguanylate cyclase (GGDEF)-like protein
LVAEQTQELRLSEERFRDLIAAVPGAVYEFVIDASGKRSLTYISDGIVDLVGLEAVACMADVEVLFARIAPEARPALEESIQYSLENLSPWLHEMPICTVASERKWIRGHSLPKREKNGATHWSGVLVDITQQKQNETRVIEMATRDLLTGLPNRYLIQDRIMQALARDQRTQQQAAVLFIDLDHFKVINDTLGHSVGDLLLKDVAMRLTAIMRTEDTVARQGGDEFIVLLPNIAATQDAETVAQKILEALGQPYYINGNEMHIGGSIGIALYPGDGDNVDILLKNSDIAMYHAISRER